jgi:type II secretory pathway predicted ATPase ExeA
MYESFFDLSSRPFPAAPVVQHYFPTAVVEQARQTLIRIVDRAEGPGLIIGQPGLGKTLLLRMLDHHFQNVFHCVHLASAAIESRKDLLQNVLFELDLPYRDMEEGELRLSLLDFLRPSEGCPNGVLLLVDEAHTLPLRLLDEIRMITNLVRDGQPRVRLVLAGDMQLEDVFADPRLDSFNQRIAARCYLEPLNQDQTIEYVQAQIAAIGGDPSGIFTHDAMVAVYRASGGIPRLINQVCDHSMVMASLGGYHQLDAAGIEEAWADLQQLPGPWNDPAAQPNADAESIVEFGSLEEGDAAPDRSSDELVDMTVDGMDLPGVEAVPFTDVTAAETGSFELEPLDATPDGFASLAVEEADPAATRETAELETLPDPANETPAVDRLPTLDPPTLDLPTADPPTADLPSEDLPSEDSFSQEFEPIGNSTPDVLLGDGESDYYESNVINVGWPNSVDSISVADEDSAGAMEEPIAAVDQRIEADVSNETPTRPPLEAATPNAVHVPEVVDPFGQGFEEEEVVIDRYANLDDGVFAGCPRVSTEEGRALAAIIERHSRPQLSVVEEVAEADGPIARDDDAIEPDVVTADESHQNAVTEETGAVARETDDAIDDDLAEVEFTAQSLQNNVFDTSSLSEWLFASTTETVGAGGTEADDVTQLEDEMASSTTADEPLDTSQVEPADHDPSHDEGQISVLPTHDALEPSFLQVHDGPNINDDRDMIVIDEDKSGGVFLTQSSDDLARRVEYQQLFSQLREG